MLSQSHVAGLPSTLCISNQKPHASLLAQCDFSLRPLCSFDPKKLVHPTAPLQTLVAFPDERCLVRIQHQAQTHTPKEANEPAHGHHSAGAEPLRQTEDCEPEKPGLRIEEHEHEEREDNVSGFEDRLGGGGCGVGEGHGVLGLSW